MQEKVTSDSQLRLFVFLLVFGTFLIFSELFALNTLRLPVNAGHKETVSEIILEADDATPHKVQIPQIIHQIYKSSLPSGWGKRAPFIQSWIEKNPNYTHTVYDDDMALNFVETHFANDTHIVQAYKKFPLIVSRTDFLRYLLVYYYGGVYADADTTCERPLGEYFSTWTGMDEYKNASFIAGLEWYRNTNPNTLPELFNSTIVNQWTFAAAPKHPLLWALVNEIADKTLAASVDTLADRSTVIGFTGPSIYTRHIFQYLWAHGEDLEMVVGSSDPIPEEAEFLGPWYFEQSQLLLMPVHSFQADTEWRHDMPKDDPYAYVSHAYSGFWDDGWKNINN